MPATSPAQERLMRAAAHTPGGYGGVSQEVGREFTKADQESVPTPIVAAGLMCVKDGCVFLVKRAQDGDAPGMWAFPGGKVEPGETIEQGARRECLEEIGWAPDGPVEPFCTNNDGSVEYTTFLCRPNRMFAPLLNAEHTDYVWADIGAYPQPLHPGAAAVLDRLTMTELDVARGIRDGLFRSPARYQNVTLFALRITGTGTAWRGADKEYVYRPPEYYLNDEFLQRCNGLFVVCEHPELRTLTSKEFQDRIVGAVILPYISNDEVWGIARIADDAAIELLKNSAISTSPTVAFIEPSVNAKIIAPDGSGLLIENNPNLIDHLAIVPGGVWDKQSPPSGVLNESTGEHTVDDPVMDDRKADATEEEAKEAKAKADAEEKNFRDSLMSMCDSLMKRMDAWETREKEKADAYEEEKKEADAKAKADADAEEEKAKADRAKADAEMRKAIADLQAKMPRETSPEERRAMADAQAKADEVARLFGNSAPAPMSGEGLRDYRARLVGKFLEYSPDWKAVDLSALPDSVLAIAETKVYADASVAANTAVSIPQGTLREIKTTDETGRTIRRYLGKPDAWLGDFKAPKRMGRINTTFGRGV